MGSLLDFINSLTPQQWFLIGGFIASIPGVIAVTEAVKRHHLKKKAEELWTGFVFINVTVWSFVLTAVDALSANLGQIAHIASQIPQITSFVAKYAPTLAIIVLLVHTVATVLYKWFKDREAKKPISNVNMPDLAAVAAREAAPTVSGNPSSSMGTASVGMDIAPPPSNIFQ